MNHLGMVIYSELLYDFKLLLEIIVLISFILQS